MDIKNIARFIYWNVIPLSAGTVVFYYFLNKADGNDVNKFLLMMLGAFGFCFIFIMTHGWIGLKIFPERKTLADKMMKCKLRRKYGNSYCVDCQDSYTCASDIEGGKGKKDEKDVKGKKDEVTKEERM